MIRVYCKRVHEIGTHQDYVSDWNVIIRTPLEDKRRHYHQSCATLARNLAEFLHAMFPGMEVVFSFDPKEYAMVDLAILTPPNPAGYYSAGVNMVSAKGTRAGYTP